jgi:bisphosphoglycerate-independent phosphoglycerate mutase (AlkP superfamily)
MEEDIPLEQLEDLNKKPKLVVLLLLDGWGVSSFNDFNLIAQAKLKNFKSLIKNYPTTLLKDESLEIRKRYWSLGTGLFSNYPTYPNSDYSLSQILADNNLKQLKISPAATFTYLNLAFNAYQEDIFKGEERLIVGGGENNCLDDSKEIFKIAEESIRSNLYDFIAISLPISDQLFLSKDFKKTVKYLDILDNYILKISNQILLEDGVLIITSPYGRIENIQNENISKNPVPLLIIAKKYLGKTIGLADSLDADLSLLSPVGDLSLVMPTILKIMEIKIPQLLENKSLI